MRKRIELRQIDSNQLLYLRDVEAEETTKTATVYD